MRRSREENAATKVLQFVLYKENRDTMAAVSTIANQLYLKPHAFAFAGTKDKRGQTSQARRVVRWQTIRAATQSKICSVIMHFHRSKKQQHSGRESKHCFTVF